ncbi:hypothetical protein [Streptomyces sp. YIM 121038]|uniref:hypothetical protein n=1 Tax=Streptomyces sp. YIM 121038 TaxID=2136401 RepID=UPI001485F3EE|nr:hypothetical protein [Streptomyces sp. YIM 121038]
MVPGPSPYDPDEARVAGYPAGWAKRLLQRGLSGEIVFDSCRPRPGGSAPALPTAAEELFVADSAAVLVQLDFDKGSRAAGIRWLLDHPACAAITAAQERDVRRQTHRLAEGGALPALPGGVDAVAEWARQRPVEGIEGYVFQFWPWHRTAEPGARAMFFPLRFQSEKSSYAQYVSSPRT